MIPWFENPYHSHAHAGGEDWFGHHYTGGEFLPFYVPRPVMPQINEADYDDFLAFALTLGIPILKRMCMPQFLRPHQRLDVFHADAMPPEVRFKACFTSLDSFILDGNHRWLLHVREQSPVPCFEIGLPFEQAIALMFAFPKTYSLDTSEERN